jgi:hypothetical protein
MDVGGGNVYALTIFLERVRRKNFRFLQAFAEDQDGLAGYAHPFFAEDTNHEFAALRVGAIGMDNVVGTVTFHCYGLGRTEILGNRDRTH